MSTGPIEMAGFALHAYAKQQQLFALKNGRSYMPEGSATWCSPATDYAAEFGGWPDATSALVGRVLVPIPSSGVTTTGRYWSGESLATALVAAGLGLRVAPCVHRTTAVVPSHKAPRGTERLAVEDHVKSLGLVSSLPNGPIALIDDMATQGNTSMAMREVLTRGGHAGDIILVAATFQTMAYDATDPKARFVVTWTPGTAHADKVLPRKL